MRVRYLISKAVVAALSTAAFAAIASPASATTATPSNDPCSIASVQGVNGSGVSTGGAIACQGYYSNNLISSSNIADQQAAIAALLSTTPTDPNPQNGYAPSPFSWDGNWNALINSTNPFFVLDTDPTTANPGLTNGILNFGTNLIGQTIIGAHFGNFPDSNTPNVTAFWLFNFTTPTAGIQLLDPNGRPTTQGFSNAALYQGAAVPEPATWAMMLVGFAGVGAAMRRRRRPALAQIA